MVQASRQTALIIAVLVLGALGVAAAFLKTIGGFSGAIDIARSLVSRLDQLIR